MTLSPKIPLRADPSARTRQGADAFVRAVVAQLVTVNEKRGGDALQTINRLWPGDGAAPTIITRAASSPAVLASNALAMTAVSDFISTLAPQSAGVQLLQRSPLSLSFDSSGAIFVPGITAAASQATFVKEADPIPVRQLSTAGVTLSPRKLAVIVPFTRDIFSHSVPTIERLVGATLSEAVSAALDSALFDTTAGDATRPPGLRNGISGQTASALTIDSEALWDDLSVLIGLVAPVAGSNPIAIVASPRQAAAIRMRQPNLPYEVFSTSGLSAGIVAAIATNAVASAMDPAPRINASIEATLVFDDAAVPAQLGTVGTPAVVGAPAKNLYAQDLVALKVVLECGWGLRTATGLSWTSSVVW